MPCIVRWPNAIVAGTVTSQVAITMDWTATFRRLAGLSPDPEGEDGQDLMPFITGQKPVCERALFWRRKNRLINRVEEGRAVRQGPWKLIERNGYEPELYNLISDLGKTSNLIAQYPELARHLVKKLDAWERIVGEVNR